MEQENNSSSGNVQSGYSAIKETTHLLLKTQRMMNRLIEKKVAHTGVYKSQHRLLMMLAKNPNCSQNELAEKMDISPAAIAVSLKKLEKGNYIGKATAEIDNRVNEVFVTEKGEKIIRDSVKMFDEMDKHLYESFSESELFQMQDYLKRMNQSLQEYLSKMEENEKF